MYRNKFASWPGFASLAYGLPRIRIALSPSTQIPKPESDPHRYNHGLLRLPYNFTFEASLPFCRALVKLVTRLRVAQLGHFDFCSDTNVVPRGCRVAAQISTFRLDG